LQNLRILSLVANGISDMLGRLIVAEKYLKLGRMPRPGIVAYVGCFSPRDLITIVLSDQMKIGRQRLTSQSHTSVLH